MLHPLSWRREPPHPELAALLGDLRADSLRFFVGVSATVVLIFYYVSLILRPVAADAFDAAVQRWALAGIVGGGLLATWLLRRHYRTASFIFLAAALLALTGARWLMEAPVLLFGYPMIALAATILWRPLAGLGTSLATLGLLAALRAGPLPSLGDDLVLATAIATVLTVVVAWALGRQLVTAIDWTTRSYAEASRNAREARHNRAELVQALKQLDQAYYRLQRANAALELAWKAAADAERSKTEFVTNISHELRTPLNLIVGFSELILDAPESYPTPLPAAYRGDLNAIHRSAQHLLTLTNDVIDLARVGMGRLVLAREPVNLAQIIDDACGIVRDYIAAKGLLLRLDLAPDVPVLALDHLRIRQVLLNLLTNAARFTDHGGITIAAAVEGAGVIVRVSDTGRGIPTADLTEVFREFHHGDPTLAPPGVFGGVGLGLPLSRRFVELHGGQMGVDSVAGVGATFWFTLPISTADGPVLSTRGHGPAPLPTERQIVVLASDDEQLTEVLQRHLSAYQVVSAPDLVAAGQLAITVRARAILAELDSDPRGDAGLPMPVLRLPLPHGGRLANELGAIAHLVKPISRQRLHGAMRRLAQPPRTILIVDDDPGFVRLLTRMLGSIGHGSATVTSAPDGQQALAAMTQQRPDLVLLDLAMPVLDGQATLTAMRHASAWATVPVVLVSAQDQLMTRFPVRGDLALHVPDGFRLETLLTTIEAVLGALDVSRRPLGPPPDAAPSAGVLAGPAGPP